MLWWPLLFALNTFAQETSVEEYCFPTEQRRINAQARMRGIFLPVDQVSDNESCFTVQTPTHRRELLQSYARRVDADVVISFSSAEIKRQPCQLKVERVKNNNANETNISLKNEASLTQTKSLGNANEIMRIVTLNHFEISYNHLFVKGECKYLTPDRYEIRLEAKHNSALIGPQLLPDASPANSEQASPNQQSVTLKTEIQLIRGQRIEVGSALKETKNESYTLSSAPHLGGGLTEKDVAEKVYLGLD